MKLETNQHGVKIGDVSIENSAFGLNIVIRFDELRSQVSCTVTDTGINYSSTGTLDKEGIAAFKRLQAIAEALKP